MDRTKVGIVDLVTRLLPIRDAERIFLVAVWRDKTWNFFSARHSRKTHPTEITRNDGKCFLPMLLLLIDGRAVVFLDEMGSRNPKAKFMQSLSNDRIHSQGCSR